MLCSELRFNIMWAGYVQKAYLIQSCGVGENLIGTFTQYHPARRGAVGFGTNVIRKDKRY